MSVVWHEIPTGGPPHPSAQHRGLFAPEAFISLHQEHLVALQPPLSVIGLENDHTVVKTPVGLSIVTSKSDLPDGFEMLFARIDEGIGGNCHRAFRRSFPGLIFRLVFTCTR